MTEERRNRAWYGMMEGLNDKLNHIKERKIRDMGKTLKPEKLRKILELQVRTEKIVLKDAKQRTFIADTTSRGELVSQRDYRHQTIDS